MSNFKSSERTEKGNLDVVTTVTQITNDLYQLSPNVTHPLELTGCELSLGDSVDNWTLPAFNWCFNGRNRCGAGR